MKGVKLSNGRIMPNIGIGTWLASKSEVKEAIKTALKVGYRHIDAAWIYGNEDEVGEAISEHLPTLKRNDLFVTTKLWNTKHHPDDVRPAILSSLSKLKLDYVDLYLIHWPMDFPRGEETHPKVNNQSPQADPPIPLEDTWRAMEDLVNTGLTKSIGVSNFNTSQLDTILSIAKIKPVVNQYEYHPYLQQPELHRYCNNKNIVVTAYSPLGNPGLERDFNLLIDPTVVSIAEKYGKTSAQILIRWNLQHGNVVIPKSTSPHRIKENWNVFDFNISENDMSEIDKLGVKNWRCVPYNAAERHPLYPFKS